LSFHSQSTACLLSSLTDLNLLTDALKTYITLMCSRSVTQRLFGFDNVYSWVAFIFQAFGFRHKVTNIKQGAHIHQPKAWPVPLACAQPYYPGNGNHRQLFRLYRSSSAWYSRRVYEREKSWVFFCYCCLVAGLRSRVQCHTTHLTHRTPDYCTVNHQTLRYDFTYLRLGAQARQKSPG